MHSGKPLTEQEELQLVPLIPLLLSQLSGNRSVDLASLLVEVRLEARHYLLQYLHVAFSLRYWCVVALQVQAYRCVKVTCL